MARGKDSRLFIPLALDFMDNAKIRPLSDKAFRTLLDLLLWSAKNQADGQIPPLTFKTFGNPKVRAELMGNHPERPSVYEDAGFFWLHDYTAHNRTREQIAQLSAARAEAGSKGGATGKQNGSKTEAKPTPEDREQKTEQRTTKAGADVTVGGRPSRYCSRHESLGDDAPPCGRCGSARKDQEHWDRENAKPAPANKAPAPPTKSELCPDHPDLGYRRTQCPMH